MKPETGQPIVQPELPAAFTDARETVIAHANRELSADEVAAVANSAEPFRFDANSLPGLELLTGREAVARICGSEQAGYWSLLRSSNPQAQLEPDKQLGEQAYSITWPACLRIDVGGEMRLVMERDTAIGISSTISGRQTANEALALLGLERASDLRAGELIELPFTAVPTALTPKADMEEDLRKALRPASQVRQATDPGAEIIMPIEADVVASSGEPDCIKGDSATYPFSPLGVSEAYRITRAQWMAADNILYAVHVVVADNGFFGVPCFANNCPARQAGELEFARGRFPRWFFADRKFGRDGLGPIPVTAPNLRPINYEMGKWPAVDRTSGHGTHVAGLVLGGPAFVPYRMAFSSADGDAAHEGRPPWFKLVIFNLSGGKREIPPGAHQWLFSEMPDLDGHRVYNLSFIMGAALRPNVDLVLRNYMNSERHRDTLFVAAAGNRLGNLDGRRLYPAMLPDLDNLITVAAADGTGTLAPFSNFSRRFVDLAAPGCKLESWIDGDSQPVSASGTSQAAPIVTFAAALLRSVWDKSPRDVRTRLIASGTLLRDKASRGKLRFPVELSIPKALLVNYHILTFTREGTERVLVGSMGDLQGFRCLDGAVLGQADIRSYKFDGQTGTVFYRVDSSGALDSCRGELAHSFGDATNVVTFDAEYELEKGVPTARPGTWSIAAHEIADVVYPD